MNLSPAPHILVTGASSGIGQACALLLDRKGYTVYAGVRDPADGELLKAQASPRLTPVRLDVTDESAIADCMAQIRGRTEILHGVVNNAGVAVACPMEFIPLDDLRRQMEINVVGLVAVTQATLPMLRAAREKNQPARIVNVSSIAGRLAFPLLGPYCASKFAVEALSDSLRMELSPWGIDISLIEPGKVATAIWSKSAEDAEQRRCNIPAYASGLYSGPMATAQARALESAAKGIPPERVAQAVYHALSARAPKTRYPVGGDCLLGLAISHLPDRLKHLLIRHKYGE